MKKHPLIAQDKPWLAPLAGYSDLSFRLLCRSLGADVCVTEMISSKGLIYNSPGTQPILKTVAADNPLVAQLFGPDVEDMAKATVILRQMGFDYFDLNSGCPVRKVVKTGSGSALHKKPTRLVELAKAIVDNAELGKVGVKMRLGWTHDDENYLDIAKELEDIGVAWITLHPRTAKQAFSGEANWEKLTRLKESVSIPIIASGDLYTAHHAVECVRQTNVDGVMFARGALANPAIFDEYKALLRGEEIPPLTGERQADVIRRHLEYLKDHCPMKHAILRMRSITARYIKGLKGAKAVRQKIGGISTEEQLYELIDLVATLEQDENGSFPPPKQG